MAQFKKNIKNPLGLGVGLTIFDDEFSNDGFNKINQAKLKAALRVNMVSPIEEECNDNDDWLLMSEEELAKTYTIPELKAILNNNFDDVDFGSRPKQSKLTALIAKLREE